VRYWYALAAIVALFDYSPATVHMPAVIAIGRCMRHSKTIKSGANVSPPANCA
jgi:hypothetical protein